jgi:hypothetical protein
MSKQTVGFMGILIRFSILALCVLSLFATAYAQLAGGSSYPINGTENPPASFATMRSAAAYLNANGVTGSGDIVLELTTGYTGESDTVGIRTIAGADSTRRVIFRPALGFAALSSIAGTAANPFTVRLAGASWVTLDGRAGGVGSERDWTIRCTGSTNGQVAVRLDNTNGSMTGIVIRNLIMEGEAASHIGTGGIFQITGDTANTTSNVIVENNLIRSNPGASTFRGFGMTIATANNTGNTGLVIRGNEITQFYAHGINFTGGFPGAKIHGNQIYHASQITQPSRTQFRGIQFSTSNSAGAEIYNNFVYNIRLTNGTTAASGIECLTLNTSGEPVKVYNNRIAIGSGIVPTTFPIYGIFQSSGASGVLLDVYYNSVYVSGSASAGSENSAAFRKTASNLVKLRNNIFYNARTNSGGTGTHWAIMSNNTTFGSIGRNDYFAGGTGGVLGTTNGTVDSNKTTIAQWRLAVPADTASVSQNPHFVNPAGNPPDLKLNPTIPTQLESGGTIVVGIDTDFEGDIRFGSAGYAGSGTAPDIGADEGEFVPQDISPPAISYSPLGNGLPGVVRTLSALITDPFGVPTSGIGLPVAYWKVNSEGSYDSVTATFLGGSGYSFEFGGGTAIGDTVFYFIAAQDSLENVGVFPSAGAGGLTPNPPRAGTPPTTPSFYVVRPGFSGGMYTVGTTTGTFPTLKAAFDSVNSSILLGDVTFSILSEGTVESATAELFSVSYDSAGSHTVTVKPASGTTPTVTANIAGFVVKFSGADNVVVDGSNAPSGSGRDLTIQNNTQVANSGVFWISSRGVNEGATNITISNCVIVAGRNDTINTFGVFAAGDTITSSGTGAHNNNLSIRNNHITRARFGVYSRGVATTGMQSGLEILDNLIGADSAGMSVSYRGIDLANTTAPIVRGNTMFNMHQTSGLTIAAIHMDVNVGGAEISRNRIQGLRSMNIGGFGAHGIAVNSATGSTNNLIVNNMISDIITYGGGTSTISNPYGIRIVGGTGHKVYYNSVSMTGEFGNPASANRSAAMIVTSNTAVGLDIRDNIFSNRMTGGAGTTCYAIFAASGTTFDVINHNDYYVAGPNGVFGFLGSDVPNLSGWRSVTGQDAQSVSGNPFFFDAAANLHIDSSQSGNVVNNAGTPIAGTTTDIDGDERHPSTPDLGADEYAFIPPDRDLRMVAVLPPPEGVVAGQNATFRAVVQNVSTTVTEPTYSVHWFVDSIVQAPASGGPIAPQAYDTLSLSWMAVAGSHTVMAIVQMTGDENPINDTARTGVNALVPLSGNINVGSGHSITTLRGMIDVIHSASLQGPTTFLLTDAAYMDSVLDLTGPIHNSSETNTLTIRPANGASPTITLRGNTTLNVGLRLTSPSHVIIDGSNGGASPTARNLTIAIDTTSSTSTTGLMIRGTTRNFTFKNTILRGWRTANAGVSAILVDSLAGQAPDSNIVFENLHVSRALNGLFIRGRALPNVNKLIVVRNCFFGGEGTQAIVQSGLTISNCDGARIYDNEINGVNTAGFPTTTNAIGMSLSGQNINIHIYRNKVHNVVKDGTGTGIAAGIQAVGQAGTPSRYKIWNNMVWDINARFSTNTASFGGPVQGLSLPSGMQDSVFFNTIYVTGTSTSNNHSSSLYIVAPTAIETTRTVLKNNIVVNNTEMGTAGRSPVVKFFNEQGAQFGQADRNIYFTSAPRGSMAAIGMLSTSPLFVTTLDSFRLVTGHDAGSAFADPMLNPANLPYIRTDVPTIVESRGEPIAGMTTDVDGNPRNAATPDVGADEGLFMPLTLAQIAASFDSVTATVTLTWGPASALSQRSSVGGQFPSAITNSGEVLASNATSRSNGLNEKLKSGFGHWIQNVDRAGNADLSASPAISYGVESRPAPPANRALSEIVLSEAGHMEDRVELTPLSILDIVLPTHTISEPSDESNTTLLRYRIYRSEAGGPFSALDSVGAEVGLYVDTRVQARSYSYYVVAVFDDGSSQPSASASVSVPFVRAEVEPNNTAATANYITMGYSVNANLSSAGDADWFRFTAPVGHLIVDATDVDNSTDVQLSLYDSTGTRLLYSVDRNVNDRLEYNLAYAGRYYVQVVGHLGATGSYALFVRIGSPTDPREPDDGPLFGFPLIATRIFSLPYRDTVATINPGVGLPGFDLDYRWRIFNVGDSIVATVGPRPGSSLNGLYLGLGRKGVSTSLVPDVLGGVPIVFRCDTGAVTIRHRVTVADTYYVYVSVPLCASGLGADQAGPTAQYDIDVFSPPVGVANEPGLPETFTLEQNYPNPFNPSTAFHYQLPVASRVILRVFNALGQEVATLLNDSHEAGYYTAIWDGKNNLGQTVGSGLYFCRMDAIPSPGGNTFSQTRKMILAR